MKRSVLNSLNSMLYKKVVMNYFLKGSFILDYKIPLIDEVIKSDEIIIL
jgi:hypothetical protein